MRPTATEPTPGKVPLGTIVIPCFNQAHFLGDSVGAALGQSYPHVEVIVVDDGSQDDTADVGSALGARVVSQENQGLSAARNTGLLAASGDVIVFCDADDILDTNALSLAFSVLAAHPTATASVGRCTLVHQDRTPIVVQSVEPFIAQGDLYEQLLAGNFISTPAVAAFRRDRFLSTGGFRTGLDAAADYEVWLRLARESALVVHFGVVAHYRQHRSSMSADKSLMLNTIASVLELQADHVVGSSGRTAALERGNFEFLGRYRRELKSQAAMVAELKALAAGRSAKPSFSVADCPPEVVQRLPVRIFDGCLHARIPPTWTVLPYSAHPRRRFASGPAGTAVAPWIRRDLLYLFELEVDGHVIDRVGLNGLAVALLLETEHERLRPLRVSTDSQGLDGWSAVAVSWEGSGENDSIFVTESDYPVSTEELLDHIDLSQGGTLVVPAHARWIYSFYAGLQEILTTWSETVIVQPGADWWIAAQSGSANDGS